MPSSSRQLISQVAPEGSLGEGRYTLLLATGRKAPLRGEVHGTPAAIESNAILKRRQDFKLLAIVDPFQEGQPLVESAGGYGVASRHQPHAGSQKLEAKPASTYPDYCNIPLVGTQKRPARGVEYDDPERNLFRQIALNENFQFDVIADQEGVQRLIPLVRDRNRQEPHASVHPIPHRGLNINRRMQFRYPVVFSDDIERRTDRLEFAGGQQNATAAQSGDRTHVVTDKKYRATRASDLLHFCNALFLECCVANCQHLVDDEDLRLKMSRNRKRKPDIHPR